MRIVSLIASLIIETLFFKSNLKLKILFQKNFIINQLSTSSSTRTTTSAFSI